MHGKSVFYGANISENLTRIWAAKCNEGKKTWKIAAEQKVTKITKSSVQFNINKPPLF